MIKKLTFSAVLFIVFVLATNSADAGFFDSVRSDLQDNHPLIKSDSNWSLSRLIEEFDLSEKESTQPESKTEESRAVKASTKVAQKNSTYVVVATAYSSTPDQTDSTPFITAWNTHVRDGIIATNFLPFGTQIKIPELYGNKIFTVEDRMNRRYTHRIDVWFPERELARVFGIKKVKIEVVSES